MTMDEVLRMDVDRALVIIRGRNVLEVDKYDYSKHPESKKLRASKAASHVPAWQAAKKTAEETKEVMPAPPPKPKPVKPKSPAKRAAPQKSAAPTASPAKPASVAEAPAKVTVPEEPMPAAPEAEPPAPEPAPKKRVVTAAKDSILSKPKPKKEE